MKVLRIGHVSSVPPGRTDCFDATNPGYQISVSLTFQPPPHVTVHLVGTGAPGIARRAVDELVADATEEVREGARLVVSELVTNAIQADEACTVSAWFLSGDGAVRIEVADSSRDLPQLRPAGDGRVGGYGLRIVDHLSARWGVVESKVGKFVWTEIEPSEDAAPRS